MKKHFSWLLALLMAMTLLLSACGGAKAPASADVSVEPVPVTGTDLSDFDLSFLKLENTKANKVYSPLSIKFALAMLEEGAAGESKQQITTLLQDWTAPRYASNQNMSLGNALFVRDTFRDSVKTNYIDALQAHFGADVIFDSFATPQTVNNWVNNKTLGLIPNLLDTIDPALDFALVNALGIDMEWEHKFCDMEHAHEYGFREDVVYDHENYFAHCYSMAVQKHDFYNSTIDASCLEFFASMDNYDLVSLLGEDNIRRTVGDAYRAFIAEHGYDSWNMKKLTTEAEIEAEVERYLDEYMTALKRNYNELGEAMSIDFSLYVDDDVKVFAKDLKTYNDTTLQYIGIMPVNEDLDTYVSHVDSQTIHHMIENLKDLKRENFEDGVITRITGYVPKFTMEYELKLMDDLKALGVTDVFDAAKADLSALTDAEGAFISEALHKATIEFTQAGIKAAAATFIGGKGGGGAEFDYIYDVPVVDIDLTFDKPYMFLIRDKDSGDVWFVGTVYDPLHWDDDTTREEFYVFNYN